MCPLAGLLARRHGGSSQKAAQAIAKLGNQHDICVVQGGFKGWKVGDVRDACLLLSQWGTQ